MKYSFITRTVLLLSFISFFTDVASEMLYPVIPIYLASLNYTAMYIGILEGIAEFIAGLSKGYFGLWSDKIQCRLPFIRIGYTLSAIAKPIMIIFSNAIWILFTRTLDRFGKGIRTAARDALLSSEVNNENKGKVFGFHRALDTLGAAVGPAIALLFLYFFPNEYYWLFIFTIIPGLITIFLLWKLKEKTNYDNKKNDKISFFSFLKYIKHSPKRYKLLISGFLLFALFNSSDMFLLLKVKELGYNDTTVIGLYIFYNLSYAIFSFPAGVLADKLGLHRIYIVGMFLFALVYIGMAYIQNYLLLWICFMIYGFYAAATEGIGKAWISNIVPKDETASAIGSYNSLQSITAMLASSLTGFIWITFSSNFAFLLSAVMAIASALFLCFFYSYIKS